MEDILEARDLVQEDRLQELIPEYAADVARMRTLMGVPGAPVVTVIGKYNHGKSRLLNELIGCDVYEVADKRQTIELQPFLHQGVCWLDAPGLDADVSSSDDRKALQAAWLEADIRLFVHAAKEGELDASERDLLEDLLADSRASQRKTLFVLSLVDQLADESALISVKHAIQSQLDVGEIHCVSSARYRRGLEQGKALLLANSGLPELREVLLTAVSEVQNSRISEAAFLRAKITKALAELVEKRSRRLALLRNKQERRRQEFAEGMESAMRKVCRILEED